MLSGEENELLTRVGPGTPMGELLRYYWIPALLSEEISSPDCAPVQVGLLGEKLVAFRDSKGKIGLLGEHCLHRGTSLFYGRNEDCGLRCIYHGWKYDVDGRIVDTPAEPPDSDFKAKIRHTAYPTKEVAGMVFAYLGPREKMPLLPEYEWTRLPDSQTYVTKSLQECNYLQGLEGDCDSAHLSYLHRDLGPDLYRKDISPTLLAEETDFGVRMVSIRKAGPDKNYVRITNFILPTIGHVSAHSNLVHYWAPIDNTHTWEYHVTFNRERSVREEQRFGGNIGPNYLKIRNHGNHYLQDRQSQRTVNFTGIEGFLAQDSCVTESMGSVCDRTKEHLGASDKTVIAIRKCLLSALGSLKDGKEPPGLVRDPEKVFQRIISTGAVVPSDSSWRQLLG